MDIEVILSDIECPFAYSDNEIVDILKSKGFDLYEHTNDDGSVNNPLRYDGLIGNLHDLINWYYDYYDNDFVPALGDELVVMCENKEYCDKGLAAFIDAIKYADARLIITKRWVVSGTLVLDVVIAKDTDKCLRWLRENHYL